MIGIDAVPMLVFIFYVPALFSQAQQVPRLVDGAVYVRRVDEGEVRFEALYSKCPRGACARGLKALLWER
jgi:hypothetical protein